MSDTVPFFSDQDTSNSQKIVASSSEMAGTGVTGLGLQPGQAQPLQPPVPVYHTSPYPPPAALFYQPVQPNINFGTTPVQLRCTNCHQFVQTSVEFEVGNFAWVVMIILLLLGLFIIMWLPLVMNECKDAVHKCPNCSHVCGVNKRI